MSYSVAIGQMFKKKPKIDHASLTPAIRAFVADAPTHLHQEVRFFKDHLYRPLLARAPEGVRVPQVDDIVKSFLSVIAQVLSRHPQHFIQHEYSRPFMSALLSIHHLKDNAARSEEVTWLSDQAFIDADVSSLRAGATVSINVLRGIDDIAQEIQEAAQQYTIRELALTLLGAFDYGSMTFREPDDWMQPLQARTQRKHDVKERYLALLDDVWSARQLGKALTQDSKDDPTKRRGRYGKCRPISHATWISVIRSEIRALFPKTDTAAKAQGRLLPLHLDQWGSLEPVGAAIFDRVRTLRKPFSISPTEITARLSQSLQQAVSDPSATHVFADANARVKTHRRRLRRMGLSGTTHRVYEPCLTISGLIQSACEREFSTLPPNLYELHVHLSSLGVTAAAIRNLFKQLYPLDLAKDPHRFHDHCLHLYPAVTRWALTLPAATGRERLYTQVFQMLTSHLAGGDFDTNMLNDLYALADASPSLNQCRYTSLKKLAADLNRNNVALEQALARARMLGFLVDDDDLELCANMRLSRVLARLMQNAPHVPPAATEVIAGNAGDVRVSILPYTHLKGALGAGVPGVCIQFGSAYHGQHLRPECRNLIVHDGERIYLWGLLVESSTPNHFYLNNFQGALPSRLRKHSEDIVDTVHQVLRELGTVYLLDFHFNSMSLCDDLPVARDVTLKLPSMRLDLRQEADGTLMQRAFYVISGSGQPGDT